MENIRIVPLIIRNNVINSCQLIRYMEYCKYFTNEIETLIKLTPKSKTLLLPSGRYGNIIALALEANNYIVAKYLIENSNRLGLNTNIVASEKDKKTEWSLKDEYLYSQDTYKEEITLIREGQLATCYPEYIDIIIRNILANESLKEKFSIKDVNQKKVKILLL